MNSILEKYNAVNTFGKLIGLKLRVIEPGHVEYKMTITEDHLSNPFAAHGGAVSAMMDGILGVAALSLAVEEKKLVSTVEFKINYFAPVEKGDQLVGRGKVIFKGNRLFSSEGKIYCSNKDESLVCSGIGTFNSYPAEKNEIFGKSV